MNLPYSNSTTDRLLGCLIQNPTLCLEDKYKLDKSEFKINKFHQILFISIYNLAINGYKSISIFDLNEFLKPYTAQYNVYLDNNGDSYVETIVELTDMENFEGYYKDFKKLSCLRSYKENGFDITNFWDEEKTDETNLENVNKYEIEDILNYYDNIKIKIDKLYLQRERDIEETQAGTGLEELKEKLQEEPMYGHSFCSELLNTVTRGMIDGQISCFSSPSGTGKSTLAIAQTCNLCARQIWDYDTKQFIDNPCQTKNGALYIQFELDNVSELSVKFLAYISGVHFNTILNGKYTDEESYRIDKAIEILKESNIHLSYMPNFTRKSIEQTLKEHILDYGIDFLAYDYIQDGSAINAEMVKSNGGVGLRTDQVLANLSDFLKLMARTYDIPVYTATQTNANLGSVEAIGVESIAGSRAVANKLDIGGVFLPLRPKELKAREILEQEIGYRGFGLPHATHIYHMYKVRFGSYPQNCKVWVNVDLGTGRLTDCMITTWDNQIIKAPKTKLEKKVTENIDK